MPCLLQTIHCKWLNVQDATDRCFLYFVQENMLSSPNWRISSYFRTICITGIKIWIFVRHIINQCNFRYYTTIFFYCKLHSFQGGTSNDILEFVLFTVISSSLLHNTAQSKNWLRNWLVFWLITKYNQIIYTKHSSMQLQRR